MDLKDFVKQTVLQACEGIEEARKENKGFNKTMNSLGERHPVKLKINIGYSVSGNELSAGDIKNESFLEFEVPVYFYEKD